MPGQVAGRPRLTAIERLTQFFILDWTGWFHTRRRDRPIHRRHPVVALLGEDSPLPQRLGVLDGRSGLATQTRSDFRQGPIDDIGQHHASWLARNVCAGATDMGKVRGMAAPMRLAAAFALATCARCFTDRVVSPARLASWCHASGSSDMVHAPYGSLLVIGVESRPPTPSLGAVEAHDEKTAPGPGCRVR